MDTFLAHAQWNLFTTLQIINCKKKDATKRKRKTISLRPIIHTQDQNNPRCQNSSSAIEGKMIVFFFFSNFYLQLLPK